MRTLIVGLVAGLALVGCGSETDPKVELYDYLGQEFNDWSLTEQTSACVSYNSDPVGFSLDFVDWYGGSATLTDNELFSVAYVFFGDTCPQ